MLPPSLMGYDHDLLLKYITTVFTEKYNVGCCAALHHNKTKTNFHIHLIFSERKMRQEAEHKIAGRNLFFNESGKRMRTKKEILDENGKIRKGCRVVNKGEIYEINFFYPKEEIFKSNQFLRDIKQIKVSYKIECHKDKISIEIEDGDEADDAKNAESEAEEDTKNSGKEDTVSEAEENLTVDNCPELAAMLSNKAEIDASYSEFASKYKGRTIEFDGRIDYCSNYENYDTRFDYLVSSGDYDPDHQIGPTFKFENVNYYDLNTDMDTVSVGWNVHIIAKVESFDANSGLFYLDPVSVTKR